MNRSYESFSNYHESLIKSFNNHLSFINSCSTESIMDNTSKFISWFKDMINRLITMISTFIKRIIAKIYELTLRSKNGLYKQFKSAIFTSVDIPIKDRKLNPNMMNDMEKYCEMINNWNVQFNSMIYTNTFISNFPEDQLIPNMSGVQNSLKEKNGINEYIDPIFYSESKKSNTTIREYFGCNAGETPKQIIILSDEYKDRLIKVKNETEKFLKELKHKVDRCKIEKEFYFRFSKNNTQWNIV